MARLVTRQCASAYRRHILRQEGNAFLRKNVRLLASEAPTSEDSARSRHIGLIGAALGIAGYAYYKWETTQCKAVQQTDPNTKKWPEYKLDDVAKHNTRATGIWVTYQGSVFDITDFVDKHPGGAKILLAAGGALEPFWALYPVHKKADVLHWLSSFKIGVICPSDVKKVPKGNDPFAHDPDRHPALRVNSGKPFNAEPPPELLVDNFITPNELFFVRNHLPVPQVDPKTYRLVISGKGIKKPIKLSLDELKKFPKRTVVATLQCAGNRRNDMNPVKKVKGLTWRGTAISTAEWSGVYLRDVLQHAGLDENCCCVKHVQFDGLDNDPTGGNYGASVPAEIALNPRGDVLLAYEMNGQELPPDHGYPLRVVIPGVAGARNVKWLSKITISNEESQSHWQQNDYKGFNPSVDWDTLDYKTAVPIQEMPVQAAICEPRAGETLEDAGQVTVRGYAWSGGGRGIIRVDVSMDGGKTWQVADLRKDVKQAYNRSWAWTLFELTMEIPDGWEGPVELVCKATDSSYNTQPDSVSGVWNVRGLLNNAWHRVQVKLPTI